MLEGLACKRIFCISAANRIDAPDTVPSAGSPRPGIRAFHTMPAVCIPEAPAAHLTRPACRRYGSLYDVPHRSLLATIYLWMGISPAKFRTTLPILSTAPAALSLSLCKLVGVAVRVSGFDIVKRLVVPASARVQNDSLPLMCTSTRAYYPSPWRNGMAVLWSVICTALVNESLGFGCRVDPINFKQRLR